MKPRVYALTIFLLLAVVAVAVTDWDAVTWRFRSGSVLKFAPGTSIQDEDGLWTLSYADLSRLDLLGSIGAGASGQVVWHDGTRWTNSTANVFQRTNSVLTTVGGIGAGSAGQVIWHDGTRWTNSSADLFQHTNAALTVLATDPTTYEHTNSVLTTLGGIGAGTSGQTIWHDGTRWTNSAANAFQSTNDVLTTIGGVGAGAAGQLFWHDGTRWTNSAANAFQSTNDVLTTVAGIGAGAAGQTLWHDGTRWTNSAADVFQRTNANLTALADNATLYQSTNTTLTALALLGNGSTGEAIIGSATGWTNKSVWIPESEPTYAISDILGGEQSTEGYRIGGTASLTYTNEGIINANQFLGSGTSGFIIYRDATRWTNGTPGSLSGVQAYSAVLDNVVGIGAGAAGQLLWHDGTRWTNSAADPFQATNAALTALAGNANLYQSTNAALTALAADSTLYQSTNTVLTTLGGIGAGAAGQLVWHDGTRWTNSTADAFQATNAALTALAGNANLYQSTNAVLTALAADSTLYQSTNTVLTTLGGIGAGAAGQLVWHDGTRWTNSTADAFQATNAALTALAGNANLYQATNAALTALAENANLYQATNANLTALADGSTVAGIRGNKALTDGAATDVFSVACAAGTPVGGTVNYTIYGDNTGTNIVASGVLTYSASALATAVVAKVNDVQGDDQANPDATAAVTWTWTADVATANVVKLQLNANHDLAEVVDVFYVLFTVVDNSGKLVTKL